MEKDFIELYEPEYRGTIDSCIELIDTEFEMFIISLIM